MMKYLFSGVAIALGLLSACQNNQSEQTDTDKTEVDTNVVANSVQECFQYVKAKDTVKLNLLNTENVITGQVTYNLYEKDRNEGIVEGEMHGDTLFVNYTFFSEGKDSVREMAFLRKGNQLVEGFGEVEERTGKSAFKNKTALKFDGSMVLQKVACK